MDKSFRSGYVSIVGRPNVGKSTLLNSILDQKIAIVTEKPQTTRNRILGVKNCEDAQIIFIDTPGIHGPKHILGERMIKTVRETLNDIDLILLVVEPVLVRKADVAVIEMLEKYDNPVFLVVNKIDTVKKTQLLSIIDRYREHYDFAEITPVSAKKKDGLARLMEGVRTYIPYGPKYFPDELITDQIERFMVTETIREKIMRNTSEEIPYSVAVEVLEWTERDNGIVYIRADIYVERQGQKGIIIGKQGRKLKAISTLARTDIERLLGIRVFLDLWVKIRKDWRDDKNALHELGYR